MSEVVFAFGSVPKDGGTFSFYRSLRPGLLRHEIDMRCVSVGRREAKLLERAFVDEGCVRLAETTDDLKAQAMAFADWCRSSDVDVVAGVNSVAIVSALPHLPRQIRVISRCASAFDHGYEITMSCRERLARIVVTAPRQARDLVSDYGADEERLCLIPNGTPTARFDAAARSRRGESPGLRLGFLGRLEHHQKGVLFIPGILRQLRGKGVDFGLRIAGKGVHGKALERKLRTLATDGLVECVGALVPDEVPSFLGDVDVLLFPSQFEGCPNALLEAMMAGCVPVASRINGITDFIIEDGRTGYVCPIGNVDVFADRVAELASDRDRLRRMGAAAAQAARERFSQARLASDYAAVIRQVMSEPAPSWTPRPWAEFRVDRAFGTPRGSIVPAPLKRLVRRGLFHLRLSDRYG